MKTLTHILPILLAFAVAPVLAGEGHDHDHSHAEVVIPATLEELWTAIQSGQAGLVAALEKKDGHAAHDFCETLMAYCNALPGKVTGVDEAKMQRIGGQAKNLVKVYGSIHHAAEDAAYEKGIQEAAKAGSVLKLLGGQLPLNP